jgi:hypothetical protein
VLRIELKGRERRGKGDDRNGSREDLRRWSNPRRGGMPACSPRLLLALAVGGCARTHYLPYDGSRPVTRPDATRLSPGLTWEIVAGTEPEVR